MIIAKTKPIILIADNRPDKALMFEKILHGADAQVMLVDSTAQALHVAVEQDVALAIVNVKMPEFDGHQLIELFRRNYQTKNLSIILTNTTQAEISHYLQAYNNGAVDYLSEQATPEIILSKVQLFLALYNQRVELEELIQAINHDNENLERQIWQRLQMEVALNEANQSLVKLNADKDKFFSIVAHDLKGPFMPLLGNAEFLTEMAAELPAEEIQDMGRAIHSSGRRVLNLLEGLLEWSRLQMGRMDYQPTRQCLKELADKTIHLLERAAEAKQIIIENHITDEFLVYADGNMLDTVIRNLMNNALKFTSIEGTVSLTARFLEEFVEVSIIDTGVGMSPAHVGKLFKVETHVTTTGTAKETGSGLGLIMCKEMVEMNGGEIWIESEMGYGTTVKFTVPQYRELVETPSKPSPDDRHELVEQTGVSKITYLSEEVNRSAKRIYGLLDALLAWVKRDLQGISHAPKWNDLTQIIEIILNDVGQQAKKKNVTLDCQLPVGLQVQADSNQLQAILQGLITNALKFTPPTCQMLISAKLYQPNDSAEYVEIAISDQGAGLYQGETVPYFADYVSQKLSGKSEQTPVPIGLLVYKELVRRNGGQLWIESMDGQGTTVRLTLPGLQSSHV